MEQMFPSTAARMSSNSDDKSESLWWAPTSIPMKNEYTGERAMAARREQQQRERQKKEEGEGTETEGEDCDQLVRELVKDLAISPVDFPDQPPPVLFKEDAGGRTWRRS